MLNSRAVGYLFKVGWQNRFITRRIQNFSFSGNNQIKLVQNLIGGVKLSDGKNLLDSRLIRDIKVTEENEVTIKLDLHKDYREIKKQVQTILENQVWIRKLNVQLSPQEQKSQENQKAQKKNLQGIKQIIAVSSCKGGVGKSTVAINLAISMQKLGKKVGLFDADIYGPSLPTLIGKEKIVLQAPEDNPKEIIPVDFENLKTMSYGFVSGKKAIARGPMVSMILTQLATSTQWGELDYLFIDFPPGTGDIQITICQELKLNGAVIVTTPQKLSFIDVVKGIDMFQDLKVPTLSVVENMAYYICDNCDKKHYMFGPGYMNMIKEQYGIKTSSQIPINDWIAIQSDQGNPITLLYPDSHPINKIFLDLAQNIDDESNIITSTKMSYEVRYDKEQNRVILKDSENNEKRIDPYKLRLQCQCASCVDEFSGATIMNKKKIPQDVYPVQIQAKGNYAVSVVWSDKHNSSIYPYEKLNSEYFISSEK